MIRCSISNGLDGIRCIKRTLFEFSPLILFSGNSGIGKGIVISCAAFSQKSAVTENVAKFRNKTPKRNPVVEVWEGMTVKQLANATKRPHSLLLSALNSGMVKSGSVQLNSKIEDRSLLTSVVNLMGFRPVFKSQSSFSTEDKDAYPRPPAAPEICTPRPPIVAILGHVDHGKTTLLDALRSSRMVDEEYGGITQHLAAFTVSLADVAVQAGMKDVSGTLSGILSDNITFLDTPGHAAFSAIRARGAMVTDIVILVVAADDSVMPQTVESIRFAKEANTPIVVAINKVDKREADVGRVVEDLATHGVVVERLGGDVQAVEISALKRMNLHNLLEAVVLQAELMQLKADPTGAAEGVVLESKMEHGIGKVATCLVTRGTLRKTPDSGPLVAGEATCSPRLLFDDMGRRVTSVNPGFVAKVAGWKELPSAGSVILELSSSSRAAEVVRYRRTVRMQKKAGEDHAAYIAWTSPYQTQYDEFIRERSKLARSAWRRHTKDRPDLGSLLYSDKNQLPTLPLFVKADVHGSLEAIRKLLSSCPSDQCVLELGQMGVGPLTETEVEYAEATGATVLLFNIPALPEAQKLAQNLGVTVKSFNIIYRLAEDVREMINALLPPLVVERVVGEAEILKLFQVKEPRGSGKPLRIPVAGCRCTKGYLLSNQPSSKSTLYETVANDAVAMHYRVIRPTRQSSKQMDTSSTVQPVNASGALEDCPSSESTDPVINGTVVISRATCRSLRHERTVVESIRKGVECGVALTTDELPIDATRSKASQPTDSDTFVSHWQVGDIIQCYVLVHQPQQIVWQFESKSVPVDSGPS